MSDRKYYVLCEQNCKFESMTKEQILTAITQAVNEGTVGDVDTGFITTVKTINGTPLKFFVGTQSEYEALSAVEKQNLFALITNDTTKEGLLETIERLQDSYNELNEGLYVTKEQMSSIVNSKGHLSCANNNSLETDVQGWYGIRVSIGGNVLSTVMYIDTNLGVTSSENYYTSALISHNGSNYRFRVRWTGDSTYIQIQKAINDAWTGMEFENFEGYDYNSLRINLLLEC